MPNSSAVTTCASAAEILTVVAPAIATSTPMNVSRALRYSFFIRLLTGNSVNVVVQISYDGREWFPDSLVRFLNLPPELVTDRAVMTADHYACFARIAASTREKILSKVAVVFQAPS